MTDLLTHSIAWLGLGLLVGLVLGWGIGAARSAGRIREATSEWSRELSDVTDERDAFRARLDQLQRTGARQTRELEEARAALEASQQALAEEKRLRSNFRSVADGLKHRVEEENTLIAKQVTHLADSKQRIAELDEQLQKQAERLNPLHEAIVERNERINQLEAELASINELAKVGARVDEQERQSSRAELAELRRSAEQRDKKK